MRTPHFVLCVAGMLAFGLQVPHAASAAETAVSVIDSWNVHSDGDVLLLPVTIDGKEYSFLVDTGSSCICVDAAMTPPLPPLAKRERVNGGPTRPMRSLPSVFVGKTQLPADAEAVEIDLSGFRKAFGHGICGVLGMPFLKNHIMMVDFDLGRLVFLKSVPDSAGRAYPLLLDRNERPVLSIDLDEDDSVPFVVDTGLVGVGAAVKLRSGRFDILCEQKMISLHEFTDISLTVGGYTERRRGWLHTLALGETAITRVGAIEGTESALGLCFLSRFIVTFDFPNRQLYLKPRRRVAEPDRLNLSGLAIWRSDADGLEIVSVHPNSPGSAAGLKAGDRIVKCDGKSVSSIRLFKLRTLLATEGLRIILDVENSTGRKEVMVDLPRPKNEETKKVKRPP